MDFLLAAKAFFLGIIEGLTEFLPISSTGHLILISDWISFTSREEKVFEVVIQLGAILAVCWLYRVKIIRLVQDFFQGHPVARRFALAVMVAFFPAAVIGAGMIGFIKTVLFNPMVIASALITGGVIILLVERQQHKAVTLQAEHIGWKQAFGVGLAQCVAMIPGTSRSGATIIGGMLSGLSRHAATEFSFFLAIPTMLGASVYDLWQNHDLLTKDDVSLIAIGFIAAFLSALLVVSALVKFVAKRSLRIFAWYRIGLGIIIFSSMMGFA